MLPEFEGVLDVYPPLHPFQDVELDRQTKRFEPLINLAKLILARVSPSPGQKGIKVYSFFIVRTTLILISIKSICQDKIADIVETDGCPYSEIAVLYAMKYPGENLKSSLPEMIEKTLESKGILNNWVSEDYRSKKTYDITTNSVTISTIHSVKGLDYSVVFLLALDFLEPRGWSEDQLDRLTYVAITRARYQVFIPYKNPSALIKKMQAAL